MTYAYERVDCHTHSAYSGHGSGSVADMVRRAEDLGLSTFAQTEHLVLPDGMDPLFETSMSSQTMKRYVDELHEPRELLAHPGSCSAASRPIGCRVGPPSSNGSVLPSTTCSGRFISSTTGP